jgi:glucose/arabinose dehydrogenase
MAFPLPGAIFLSKTLLCMVFGIRLETAFMKPTWFILWFICINFACNNKTEQTEESADSASISQTTIVADTNTALPTPYATPSATNRSKVIGWPAGTTPAVPPGFSVSLFADSLSSPRWIYAAPGGDIFVSQADGEGKKGNNVLLFRDRNKDGKSESRSVYLSGLNQPFGMLILNGKFYVANTDALLVYPYDVTDSVLSKPGKKIASFPTGRHWTRNIIANTAGSKIYISVGSGSNIADNGIEKETRRANILEINPDGSGERIYASGLRNPVGMAWAPGTQTLWTAVNERDELGDDLVPDFITSVKDGGFYGWPYSYYGQHEDPRIKGDMKRPDLVSRALVPDVALGSHTSSMGLAFYNGSQFPAEYNEGAFVGQHGSWNRSHLSGYQVMFVPFKNGKPSGKPKPFMTGFIANEEKSEVYGRPVGVAMMSDGSLLVADDGDSKIWRITYSKQ